MVHEKSMKSVRWLSLDFSDTLVHAEYSPTQILLKCAQQIELALKDEHQALKTFARLLFETRLRYQELQQQNDFQGILSYWEDLLSKWAAECPIALSEKERKQMASCMSQYLLLDHGGVLALYPDVLPTLKELKKRGYRLAVISNTSAVLYRWLNLLGVTPYLDVILPCIALGTPKPDPRAFKLLLEKTGAMPHEIAHIGDGLNDDFRGAQHAGLHALLLDREETTHDREILHHLQELLDIFHGPPKC
jgi:HAD superfamily hydrolase (TIGR01509 family)